MATTDEVAAAAREVLESSNLEDLSERKLRQLVQERTGADTNLPDLRALIHSVVEEFVAQDGGGTDDVSIAVERREQAGKGEKKRPAEARGGNCGKGSKRRGEEESDGEEGEKREEEAKEEDENRGGKRGKSAGKKFELTESGDIIVCKLSGKRKVTVNQFKGKLFVNIREYWEKGGKELPSNKGISLPLDQWEILERHVVDVGRAIKEASNY